MKEILIIKDDGSYIYSNEKPETGVTYIEIPKGADTYLELNKRNLAFYKDNFKYCYLNESEGWVKTDGCSKSFTHFKALWKRQSMIKPKEYLFKGIDGEYRVVNHDCQGRAIEIPEGSDTAILYHGNKELYFWKNSIFHYRDEAWVDCTINENITTQEEFLSIWDRDCSIVWQRHTKPEELPFVDDDCVPKRDHGSPLIRPFISVDDQVNHPQHYSSGSIECIDAIESSMTSEAFAGFLKGNVQKYMWRYENKGGVESLQKAQWYLNRLILLQSA